MEVRTGTPDVIAMVLFTGFVFVEEVMMATGGADRIDLAGVSRLVISSFRVRHGLTIVRTSRVAL